MTLARYPTPVLESDLEGLYHLEALTRGLPIPKVQDGRYRSLHGSIRTLPPALLVLLDHYQATPDAARLYAQLQVFEVIGACHPISPDPKGRVPYRTRWDLDAPEFRPKPVPISWLFAFIHLALWPPRDNVTISLTPQYLALETTPTWYAPILPQDIIVSPGYGPNYRGARVVPAYQVVSPQRESLAWRTLAATLPDTPANAVSASTAVVALQDQGFTLDEAIVLIGWLARKHAIGEAKRKNGGAVKTLNGRVWVEFN